VEARDDGGLLRCEFETDLLSLLRVQGIEKRGRGLRHLLGLRCCIFIVNAIRRRVNRTEVAANRSYAQHGRNQRNSLQAALLLSLTMHFPAIIPVDHLPMSP